MLTNTFLHNEVRIIVFVEHGSVLQPACIPVINLISVRTKCMSNSL
jgi:hypothetical protein